MCTKGRIFWLLVPMLFSLQMGVLQAGEKDTPPGKGFSGVHFKEGHLRVSVENQKFQKVMDEVAQKAGIRIVIDKSVDENLTVHFDYLPLEEGLKKLMRERNYVFIYFSEKPLQAARLKQVYVVSKSEERIAANIKGGAESRSAHGAGQKETRNKMQNLDQKSLEEILQIFFRSGMEMNEEMMQEIRDLGEELGKEFSKALEMIQKMEGFEQLMGFEGKAGKGLPTQPEQKGSVREMKNVDRESFDEVLKDLPQRERQLKQ